MPDLAALANNWPVSRHAWPMIAAGCLGLIVAAASWYAVSIWEERLARAEFTAVANEYATALQNGLNDYLDHIVAVRAFYDASREVDPEEFQSFTRHILQDYADIMRLVWAPRVTREERPAFEREAEKLGLTGYRIRTWSLGANPDVSPPRDEYFPILYSTVASQRTASFGLDINSEPVRGEAIRLARERDALTTAQAVTIRNPIKGQREGIIAVIPVYRHGTPRDSVEDRLDNTLGVLAAAIPIAVAFDAILDGVNLPQTVDLHVYGSSKNAEGPVYVRGASASSDRSIAKPEKEFLNQPQWSTILKAGNASWRLIATPSQQSRSKYYRAWLVSLAVVLLFSAILAYMWASFRHARRLEEVNEKILELAETDLLTNLANRRAFMKRLTMAIAAAWRGGSPFAVLYLDIDNFKDVNDTLGHGMGDLLLKEVVHRLNHAVRAEDFLARFGGDEFAIFMDNVTEPAQAGALAARIGGVLTAPFSLKGHKIRVTSSIGIALYAPDVTGPEEMLMQADLALYRAKDDGRNCYRFHSRELDSEVHERVQTAEELRIALDHNELELYYQPQVELATGRIVGLEALIRWNHKTRGLLTPGAFIAIAEKTGTILPLGQWVFDEACRQFKRWRDEGIAPLILSVNVSGVQFRGACELEREVESSLTRWQIPPDDLELELTESVLMQATQRHHTTLEKLRRLGIKIAIDDFGTGYSSLKYLTTYSVNRLKLAPEFVFRVTVDYRNAAVVKAAIRLAGELGLDVIAEGVETDAQMRFLLGAGCERGQGYYFSPPVDVAKVTELLRSGRIEPQNQPLRPASSSAA